MYAPPSDPRDPTVPTPTDSRSLVAAFLLAAVIPVGVFVSSRPLVGVVGLVALLGVALGVRRVTRSIRRLRVDRRLQFDLPGGVSLLVLRRPVDRTREERSSEV